MGELASPDMIRNGSTNLSSAALTRYRHLLTKGKDPREGLVHLKRKAPVTHISAIISDLFGSPFYQKVVAPVRFPKNPAEAKSPKIIPYKSLEWELTWTACILKHFQGKLARFVELEAAFFDKHFGGGCRRCGRGVSRY